eukprot:jgi/Mesen1/962/ME000012S00511
MGDDTKHASSLGPHLRNKMESVEPDSLPAQESASDVGPSKFFNRQESLVGHGHGKAVVSAPKVDNSFLAKLKLGICLVLWMGIFHFNTVVIVTSLLCLPNIYAITALAIYTTITVIPVDEKSAWGTRLARFVSSTVPAHFPLKVIYEDKDALNPDRSYVIALEPHSVLPISVVAFCNGANLCPLTNIKTLASSVLDYVPLCRHLWRWMGMAGVSRDTFAKLLQTGTTCILIPGGVQECTFMRSDQEVLFLKKRRGFIKMAMSQGTPLIPAFAFGQRNVFKFWFPRAKWYQTMSRRIRFAPMVYWGMFGCPIPLPVPMTIVVGKPIEVTQVQTPSEDEVTAVQNTFLSSLTSMYDRYKEELGAKDIELIIL